MARRLSSIPGTVYERVLNASGIDEDPFEPAFHWDVYQRALDKLKAAKRPRRIFAGSMGEMCFEGKAMCFNGDSNVLNGTMPTLGIQAATADFCRQIEDFDHTVLLLTKRPDFLEHVGWPGNVHLGVSVTGNNDAHRIETLRRFSNEHMGPSVIWASVEPLLDVDFDPTFLTGLDWVVIGFQTGTRYDHVANGDSLSRMIRRSELEYAVERTVEWCKRQRIPVFCKGSVSKSYPNHPWPREYPK
jgi:protein gp37